MRKQTHQVGFELYSRRLELGLVLADVSYLRLGVGAPGDEQVRLLVRVTQEHVADCNASLMRTGRSIAFECLESQGVLRIQQLLPSLPSRRFKNFPPEATTGRTSDKSYFSPCNSFLSIHNFCQVQHSRGLTGRQDRGRISPLLYENPLQPHSTFLPQ